MQSVSQHDFARIPNPSIQRSKFDRSHGYKTTFDAGDLVPIFYDEALPGDTFKLSGNFFARLNTPITPILDNAYFETFFFEVPVRQVWENWEKFNGEQDNPGDSTDYLIPTMTSGSSTGYVIGTNQDHLGIPVNVPSLTHSALPLRAIHHIWNTWFRDQNLQDQIVMDRGDGPDTANQYTTLLKRGKRHDYFTGSLPFPQKSDSGSVSLPLGTEAPIQVDLTGQTNPIQIQVTDGPVRDMTTSGTLLHTSTNASGPANVLFANLTEATSATINQLRQSIAVQQMFERDARGGTRYIETIKSHFGVKSPDLRLQRPGFLGGGRSQLNVSPVAQTQASAETTDTPQANLAAIGTVTATNHGFTRSFTEHSIIIGFAAVRADITYQKGLERSWSRQTRFDFYWPTLATLGEQEVLQKEIFADGTADDEIVFGYQERFAEYRYKPSLITGHMRSESNNSLDFWHLSQDFANAPVLGPEFISENPPFDRVVATPDEPHFKMDAYFNLNCARPMPMYGIPGLDKL